MGHVSCISDTIETLASPFKPAGIAFQKLHKLIGGWFWIIFHREKTPNFFSLCERE